MSDDPAGPGDDLLGGLRLVPAARLPAPDRLRHAARADPHRPRERLDAPGNAFSCDGMDTIIPGVQRLNEAARAKGIPIVYTTTAYAVTDGPNTDMGLWHHKIPVEVLQLGTDAVAIDERIAPEPGEHVIVKKHASAFFGTHLANMLRAAAVDTVIITGVTMAGCVRHTTEDAIGYGFRPIVVRECVGDRVAGVVEWNLFDIDAKFGDVEPLETVLDYLAAVAPPAEAAVDIASA